MKKTKLLAIALVLALVLGTASISLAAPSAQVTGGTTLIEGYTSTVQLTCVPAGFTQSSPAYTYEWYTSSGVTPPSESSPGTLDNSVTAASFTVPTGLTTGTYYYACKVTEPNGGSAENAFAYATITVQAATYTLAVSPSPHTFTAAVEGYAQPAAQQFTITNNGNSDETGVAVVLSDDTNFEISTALSSTTIAAGASATFSVRPKTGLLENASPYTCTANVTSTHNTSAVTTSPTLSFTVNAKTYTLEVTPAGGQTFTEQVENYTVRPAAITYTIKNTGNTQETGIGVVLTDTTNFEIVQQPAATSLAPNATTTFKVQPKLGAAAGTHTCIANVTGANNITPVPTGTMSFTVASPTYALELLDSVNASLSSHSFGNAGANYIQPNAITVKVKNTGNSAVTLTGAKPTSSLGTGSKYTIGNFSSTTVPAGGSVSFTIRPNAGLVTGTYTETITVNGSNSTTDSFTVTFVVDTAKTYKLQSNPTTYTFTALVKNYTSPGTPVAFAIANSGTESVTVQSVTSSASSSAFTINVPSTLPTLASGSSMAITVQPKTGLAQGVYTETITVQGDNNARATFTVSVTVGSAAASSTTIYNSGRYIAASGAFSANSTLTTTRLYSGSARYDGLYKLRDGKTAICCYDISVSPAQTVSGKIDLSFSLGTEYAGHKMTVLHTLVNGRAEYLYGTVASNGVLTVTTSNGLSPFMVIDGTLTALTITSPDTGDASTFAFVGIALMLCGCALLIWRRKRA